MKVSMTEQSPVQEGVAATIPHAGRELVRRMRAAQALQAMLPGSGPDPRDTALFRTLLSDEADRKPTIGRDPRDADIAGELAIFRPDCQDEIGCVSGWHANTERQEGAVVDTTPAASLDLAALSGMVTKVYLDSLHDRQRGVTLALDDAVLPATRLSVLEQEGRLAVGFVSMNERSRTRLGRGAPVLAQRIAKELSRDVSVKVAAHDGDPLALEVHAHPSAGPWSWGAV